MQILTIKLGVKLQGKNRTISICRSSEVFEYDCTTNRGEAWFQLRLIGLESKLMPCPSCQDASVKESTLRVHWEDSACDIKHYGAHKGSLWFCRRWELFSHLVSWLHPYHVWPYSCLIHKDNLWVQSELAQLSCPQPLSQRRECFKPHLTHKQCILKVTVLVLQYVNL